jgi:hypothetical protein
MGCHRVRRYLSQPPDGVRSSPSQLLKGEIQGYTMELLVRAKNTIFNTTKLFHVDSIEKSCPAVGALYER